MRGGRGNNILPKRKHYFADVFGEAKHAVRRLDFLNWIHRVDIGNQFARDKQRQQLVALERGEAEFTGTLRGVLKSGDSISEVREVHGEFQLDDHGKWRISRLKFREILTR